MSSIKSIVNRLIAETDEENEASFVCELCGQRTTAMGSRQLQIGDMLVTSKENQFCSHECFEKSIPNLLFLARSGVPKTLAGCTLENYQAETASQKKALTQIRKMNRWCLTITGPAGTGKTHLAIAVLRKVFLNRDKNKLYCRFVTAPDILMQIKQTYRSHSSSSELEIVDSLTRRGQFLCLDDFGTSSTAWANEIMYSIINRRYNEGLPMVVTSNLSIQQVAQQIDARLASRLASGTVVSIDSKDYRLKPGFVQHEANFENVKTSAIEEPLGGFW